MQVGIGLPNTLTGADADLTLSWAKRAEAGPFSSIGVFDRIVYDSLDPLSTLAVCAGATEDIRLATSIVAGPVRSTGLLAKKAATVDVLSDGRLTLGVALGARREDYEAANAEFRGRGSRFTKQLDELRDIWQSDEIGPDPVQEGGPELLIGGSSDPTYKRVGRYGDGYIHGGGPPRAFAKEAEKARGAWNEEGRPGDPTLWGHGYFALGDDEAAEKGREYLLDYYEFTGPFAERIADGLLTTPQEVIQFVRGYEEEGCDELLLFPTVPDIEQYERLETVIENEWDA
ncbi:LLM class flavin-dependent oxidoreductase [Natronosalvus halobius]|uniref:LLM class flavin-dependent oxidoreductase n=1 Tax=Natronosalvus halobius TaxID=2953746 RepID=UPI00209DA987|nr:LLM class flavin-dependent oxidoreductase [Natronosalvus halobius]USZ73623.1 LLM class flavin-dependent oxidoreductase [Natronosalvus halobius]